MFDTNLDADFFKEVYRLRWKIESNYNLLKNQMQLENFSSILSDCILQDIYAQTFLLNLAACLETECNDDIDKINESGRRKYPVTVNRTVCISELSDSVIELFWASSRKKDKIFKISKFVKTLLFKIFYIYSIGTTKSLSTIIIKNIFYHFL